MIRTIECDEKQSFGRIQSDNGSGLIYGDREGVHIESVIIFCVSVEELDFFSNSHLPCADILIECGSSHHL